ncbi:MAG: Lrp/AsnC family transcriptional regulator [Solibacillus sp.]
MDLIDRSILEELTKDSRLTMSELGRRVHLSSPAVKERVRQLEEKGIITNYTIKVNHKNIGYPISAIIEASIKNTRYQEFKEHISMKSEVEFCYRISGDACFMLKAHFATFEDAELFINELLPYATTKTGFIFSEVIKTNDY